MKPAGGNWRPNFGPFLPAEKKPLVSWWAEKSVQEDRTAFQRQLVATEIARLNNGSQRFGGSIRTHDKFQGGK